MLDLVAQNAIETLFEVSFRNPDIVCQALTTRNRYFNVEPDTGCSERMELLGDAVLRLLVVEYLHKKLYSGGEGKITLIIDRVVTNQRMGQIARMLGIDKLIRMGPHDPLPSVEYDATNKLHSDALEAIFGAIVLDQGRDKGLECIECFLKKYLFPTCDGLLHLGFYELMSPKNRVQILVHQQFQREAKYVTGFVKRASEYVS